MSATLGLQTALVALLDQAPHLSGVYHDTPARAAFPYAVLNCSDEKDWSCKGREGREVSLQLSIWDDQPSRLLSVESSLEHDLKALALASNWHLSTMVLTGKRRVRDPAGPWSCMMEYRARLLQAASGDEA
jgi:hypothetical protein